MNEQSLQFVKSYFRKYYKTNSMKLPPDYLFREWGITGFGEPMNRHLTFADETELNTYLQHRAPAHVYYNGAIFEHPAERKMVDKVWLGADLIFDIDREPEGGETLGQSLEKSKQDLLSLIDVLRGDFGFKDLDIVFSGKKGYHCHVLDNSLRQMTADERRDMVDYIKCVRYTPRDLSTIRCGGLYIVQFPKMTAGGRDGNLTRALIEYLKDNVFGVKRYQAVKNLSKIPGIGPSKATAIMGSVDNVEALGRGIIRGDQVTANAWKTLLNFILLRLPINIDQRVTIDVHRLIKLPGTLHGKTGLKVVNVRDIESFNPLTDATILSERLINIDILMSNSMEIGGQNYTLRTGVHRVPENLAVLSICGGTGEIVV